MKGGIESKCKRCLIGTWLHNIMSTNNHSSEPQQQAASTNSSRRRHQAASDIAEAASILTGQRYHHQQQPAVHPSSLPLLPPLQFGYVYAFQPPLPSLPSTSSAGLLPTNAVTNSSIYGSQALPVDTTSTSIPPTPNVTATAGLTMPTYNTQMDMNAIVLAIRAREASLVSARAHLQAQIARAQLEDLTAILSAHSGPHSPGFIRPHETIPQRQHPSASHAAVSVTAPSVPSSKEQADKSSCKTKTEKSKKKPSKKKSSPDDAPRRPLSAYNYFYIDEREKILQQKQEEAGTAGESTTTAGPIKNAKWGKNCNGDYDIEMSEPVREMLERQKLPSNEGRRRPHRKRHGVVSFQELAKTIARRWRSLPADQIQYYRKIASFDLRRYQAQMFDYNQNKLRREGDSSSPQAARKSEVPKAA